MSKKAPKSLTVAYYWNGDAIPQNQLDLWKVQWQTINVGCALSSRPWSMVIYTTEGAQAKLQAQIPQAARKKMTFVKVSDVFAVLPLDEGERKKVAAHFTMLESHKAYSCQRDMLILALLHHAVCQAEEGSAVLLTQFSIGLDNVFPIEASSWYEGNMTFKGRFEVEKNEAMLAPSIAVAQKNPVAQHILREFAMKTLRLVSSGVYFSSDASPFLTAAKLERYHKIMVSYGMLFDQFFQPMVGGLRNGFGIFKPYRISSRAFSLRYFTSWMPGVSESRFEESRDDSLHSNPAFMATIYAVGVSVVANVLEVLAALSKDDTFQNHLSVFSANVIEKLSAKHQEIASFLLAESKYQKLLVYACASGLSSLVEYLLTYRHMLRISPEGVSSQCVCCASFLRKAQQSDDTYYQDIKTHLDSNHKLARLASRKMGKGAELTLKRYLVSVDVARALAFRVSAIIEQGDGAKVEAIFPGAGSVVPSKLSVFQVASPEKAAFKTRQSKKKKKSGFRIRAFGKKGLNSRKNTESKGSPSCPP